MPQVHYLGKLLFNFKNATSTEDIFSRITSELGLARQEYYLMSNGKILCSPIVENDCSVHVVSRLPGGKGGFGSMLRAIGAQIEKTTNREACRDLSGRRLRDINEEQRLKNWIAQQTEREKEAMEKRQKKLERMCEMPKYDFKDEGYEKERSALPERLEDAVSQGIKAAQSTSTGVKRKSDTDEVKKKKRKLWLDADDDLSSSVDSDESDDDGKSSEGTSTEQSSKPDLIETDSASSKDIDSGIKSDKESVAA